MRRWHAERALMLRRWRFEIGAHGGHSGYRINGWGGNDWVAVPVPPPSCDLDTCHCFRGAGYFRKRHPFDCGNPRCGLCHFEKFWVPKARATKKRAAIQYELDADDVELP
jgi:hypothetical protein